LYFVNGQESKLDQLYNYLPSKEKEAYELLRTNQVLRDSECEPAIRVALRSLKDFSFSFEINGELFWKWHLTSEEEARKLVGDVKPAKKAQEIKIKKEVQKPLEQPFKTTFLKNVDEKRSMEKDDNFMDSVLGALKYKNINILESNLVRKNREVEGKIKINSDLGILEYYFLAKNKKSLNEADLSLANDRGRKNKLPVLFLSNGNLSKKAEKYLDENLKGRVIFRKI